MTTHKYFPKIIKHFFLNRSEIRMSLSVHSAFFFFFPERWCEEWRIAERGKERKEERGGRGGRDPKILHCCKANLTYQNSTFIAQTEDRDLSTWVIYWFSKGCPLVGSCDWKQELNPIILILTSCVPIGVLTFVLHIHFRMPPYKAQVYYFLYPWS